MNRTFIVSWDMTGLEAVVDITQDLIESDLVDKESLFDRIKNPEQDIVNVPAQRVTRIMQMMIMRARANAQRHYEVYSVNTTEDISKEDLEQMFNDDPQTAVDLIRDRGQRFYSDRVNKRTQVIV